MPLHAFLLAPPHRCRRRAGASHHWRSRQWPLPSDVLPRRRQRRGRGGLRRVRAWSSGPPHDAPARALVACVADCAVGSRLGAVEAAQETDGVADGRSGALKAAVATEIILVAVCSQNSSSCALEIVVLCCRSRDASCSSWGGIIAVAVW